MSFLARHSAEKTAKYSSSLQRIKLGKILTSTEVAPSLSFPVELVLYPVSRSQLGGAHFCHCIHDE